MMRTMPASRSLLPILAVALFSCRVQAADPDAPPATPSLEERVKTCSAITDAGQRLGCFDALGGDRRTVAIATETPPEEPAVPSRISRRWELEDMTQRGRFALVVHRPNYVLPVTWNNSPDLHYVPVDDPNIQKTEAKFQLSIKVKLWQDIIANNGDLWATYTQQVYWQAYGRSAPIRETDYEPTLLLSFHTSANLLGLDLRMLGVELDHQSNGRGDLDGLSRSWNRVIGQAVFEHGAFAAQARVWWRIPEPSASDNNPDIQDYLGKGDLLLSYALGNNTLSAQLRGAVLSSKPHAGTELTWSFPLGSAKTLRGYLQYYNGYGESLIDYNVRSNRIGVGFAFADWY